ncbi:MAG: ABC transporter permease [Eubacteriales bacterium]|jgi:spermidine/putrescine transport system permease protein|nr:ABC transporter permease [Eubacteriales bacterium]NCC81618.1 ABC transporter permease [Clostridia bacterium]
MKKNYLAYPYILWLFAFILIPLFLVLFYSVSSKDSSMLTLDNYKRFFDPIYIQVFVRSVNLSLIATLICLVIGYPVAWIIANMEPAKRNFWVLLFVVPMWMNFLLRTYAWMTILENTGIINTLLEKFGFQSLNLIYNSQAVVLGMVYNFLPFMVFPIYSILVKIDKNLLEAAQDLGADKKSVFMKVIFPLSLPGVLSGAIMTFMPAVSTFAISRLLGGGKVTLIGNVIEQQFLLVNDWYFGSALSIIMMGFILIFVYILRKVEKDDEERSIF